MGDVFHRHAAHEPTGNDRLVCSQHGFLHPLFFTVEILGGRRALRNVGFHARLDLNAGLYERSPHGICIHCP